MNSKPSAIVAVLNGINRYNPENAPVLEAYVREQCEKQFYDLEANLATLKLYQFVPKEFKLDVVCAILVKALMRLPHSDFTLCKCLIEFRRCEDPDGPIVEILKWHELLEKCEIREFWKRLSDPNSESILRRLNITDFDKAIRRFVCYVVSNTFQRIKLPMLRDWLGGLSDSEFSALLTANGWRLDGDLVFIANQDELVKSRDVKEHVTIDAIAPVVTPHCH